jgi:hypothetical protein
MSNGPTPQQLAAPGTEQAHQTALFAWAALHTHKWPELEYLFHVPNGGTRNKIEAGHLKAMGVRSGVPDVFLPVPRWGRSGLWIEMKVENNQLTKHQENWIGALNTFGYAVVVCYGWEIASEYIVKYLDGESDDKTKLYHRT